MYSLAKPSDTAIRRFIEAQRVLPFSYSAVGSTASKPPSGFTVDHNRVRVGEGRATFERACAAIRRWSMFEMPWIELHSKDATIEPGSTVAILVRSFGMWSLNACRIVYVIENAGPIARFGFAYGTLPEHAECGEECFSIEWNRTDDSVEYDILAFSRPAQWLSIAAKPLVRHLQRRFARDSLRAMLKAGAP